ncbi:unnamed protein product [Lactuca saligna]|uniref:Protein kinase domain-containing protein n=1 Tax=Lactuca saligna TaxID=75948 RepID=A0AA36EDY7_LACSI|nr:unnamed protein product [Lactuca saligna]
MNDVIITSPSISFAISNDVSRFGSIVENDSMQEFRVIVEDVTDNRPPGIPSSVAVMPYVQDESSDGVLVIRNRENEIVAQSHSKDVEDDKGVNGEHHTTVAKAEDGMHGLQMMGTLSTFIEYMVNGSLRHVLLRKDKSFDRRKRLLIMQDVAVGMEYLHWKNIVHFDLKCENLLVNLGDPHRPVCKIGDFGLSRIKRNTLVSGEVRGTLPLMAPELFSVLNNLISLIIFTLMTIC